MEDTSIHQKCRKELVASLRAKGITNNRILTALSKIPRHYFIPERFSEHEAYEDKPLDIGEEQTISQPYTVAYQTDLLDVREHEKILEVGTGSGYQAAVLWELGAHVYTVERQKKLYIHTKQLFSQLGYTGIKMFHGDGNEGLSNFAPFDKIIVTAAAKGVPAKLVDQLKIGGSMVIPVNGNIQKMLRVIKTSATETKIQEFDDFRFVPLLAGVVSS